MNKGKQFTNAKQMYGSIKKDFLLLLKGKELENKNLFLDAPKRIKEKREKRFEPSSKTIEKVDNIFNI
jgi:hypothetical protein